MEIKFAYKKSEPLRKTNQKSHFLATFEMLKENVKYLSNRLFCLHNMTIVCDHRYLHIKNNYQH